MNKSANIFAPARRPLRPARPVRNIPIVKEPVFTLEFFVCFVSFTMLLYSASAGTYAIAAFLAPWAIVIMKRFFSIPQILRKSWPLLIMPAWVLASILWSIEPAWTLRASLEFTATVAVGILAAYCVPPRILIASLLCAFAVIVLACMAKPETLGAIAAHMPIQGIFGSKNAFSAVVCTFLLISVAVFSDKKHLLLFRLMALGGICVSPLLLYFGRSMDAILAAGFVVSIFLAVRLLARLDHKIRLIAVIFIFLFALGFIVIMSFAEFDPAFILNALGKDSTLTGRTHLWHRAVDFISERPLLGVGYDAFWRMDNLNAREMWYAGKVPMGAGYNFHDEYLDMWVSLGAVGLLIFLSYFFVLIKRLMKNILRSMSPEHYFALLLFIFLLIRSPVESGIFGQFSINIIFLCLVWKFLQPPTNKMNSIQ